MGERDIEYFSINPPEFKASDIEKGCGVAKDCEMRLGKGGIGR